MTIEQSYFGDGSGTGSGNVTTIVHNQYGPRNAGKTVGTFDTDGAIKELVIDFDGTIVGDGAYPLLAPTLPAGAIIEDVYLVVTEAFVLGGTTPVIDIGTEGTEATNGFTITEAQAEATGTYDLTSALSGTWAAGLAAATTVGILLGGGTPSVTSAGKARAVIRYVQV
jgi:hypothetical protein